MRRFHLLALSCCLTLLTCGAARAAAEKKPVLAAPVVRALADDAETRGDWLGTYGRYVHVLCGMRSPQSFYGGPGWPLKFEVGTGDPKEGGRGWRSTAPALLDRSVLLEPNGLQRTPAVFDDHGEARPLGAGPDLYVQLQIPEGLFLLSLYFFEVDWIQYRAYDIAVLDQSSGQVLAQGNVDNFFKGKYKRFAVAGPASLKIVIARGGSPNTVLGAVFLDRIDEPPLPLLPWLSSKPETEETPVPDVAELPDLAQADAAAAEGLKRLVASSSARDWDMYLQGEQMLFRVITRLQKHDPRKYVEAVRDTWPGSVDRLERARLLAGAGAHADDLLRMQYTAAYGAGNFPAARRSASAMADDLLRQTVTAGEDHKLAADRLEGLALLFLEYGRRAEAGIFMRACARYCLESEEPDFARIRLVRLGQRALRGGGSVAIADALKRMLDKNAKADTEDVLLSAALFYLGGRNSDAAEMYGRAEPGLPKGKRHQWVLVAIITALLRQDKVDEADAVAERFYTLYPDAAARDEVRYRFAVHALEKRDLQRARDLFERLGVTTASPLYRKMVQEQLERVKLLQSLKEPRKDAAGG